MAIKQVTAVQAMEEVFHYPDTDCQELEKQLEFMKRFDRSGLSVEMEQRI